MSTRRQALRLVVMSIGLAALEGCDGAAPPAAFHDDLAGVADGVLAGRRSRSGHLWMATGAGTDSPPVVLDGAIGPPSGHVPGSSGAADAGYAVVDLGAPARTVGADFRWDPSASVDTSLALGAFTWPASHIGRPVTGGERRGSNIHLSIRPTGMMFAVFTYGPDIDFTALAARGADDVITVFDKPMQCDGATEYRAEVVVHGDTARVSVADQPTLVFCDPRIRTVPARYPFWEYFSVPGAANLPRFSRVWADPLEARSPV